MPRVAVIHLASPDLSPRTLSGPVLGQQRGLVIGVNRP